MLILKLIAILEISKSGFFSNLKGFKKEFKHFGINTVNYLYMNMVV